MRKFLSFLTIAAFVLGLALPAAPASAATLPMSQIQSGDLIRGASFPAVYYMGKDGFRYVFPNDKTYFTWYNDFASVKWISDADMTKIQIGGNVTYRPGKKMIKINSDPKTYAVGESGGLFWVTSEAIAISMYGTNWNKMIDDVPDGFFGNYKVAGDINAAADFIPADETAKADNINSDKGLQTPIVVEIRDNGFTDANLRGGAQKTRPQI